MWRNGHGDTEHGDIKRKMEAQAIFFNLFCLLFAHRANESLSFVCFLTKKQMEVIRLQMDYRENGLNALAHLYGKRVPVCASVIHRTLVAVKTEPCIFSTPQ
jgi:hypothetical protein